MVYEVPASKKSLKQNRFEFTMPAKGKARPRIHSVPLLKFLKPALVVALNEMSGPMAMKTLLESEAPGVLDEVEDLEQLEGLFQAWGEASGLDLGESSASPES